MKIGAIGIALVCYRYIIIFKKALIEMRAEVSSAKVNNSQS